MNDAYKFKLGGCRAVLNIQHSSIGGAYLRLFVEVSSNKYYNVDFTCEAAFSMTAKNFTDWASDAEVVEGSQLNEFLREHGLKPAELEQLIAKLKSE